MIRLLAYTLSLLFYHRQVLSHAAATAPATFRELARFLSPPPPPNPLRLRPLLRHPPEIPADSQVFAADVCLPRPRSRNYPLSRPTVNVFRHIQNSPAPPMPRIHRTSRPLTCPLRPIWETAGVSATRLSATRLDAPSHLEHNDL